jgi:hypothetical protein
MGKEACPGLALRSGVQAASVRSAVVWLAEDGSHLGGGCLLPPWSCLGETARSGQTTSCRGGGEVRLDHAAEWRFRQTRSDSVAKSIAKAGERATDRLSKRTDERVA